jgi:hypothetical protein
MAHDWHDWFGKPDSLDAAWEGYINLMRPPDVEAARLAFWTGANVLLSILIAMDDEPTEADLATMERLCDEIKEFAATFDNEVMRHNVGR